MLFEEKDHGETIEIAITEVAKAVEPEQVQSQYLHAFVLLQTHRFVQARDLHHGSCAWSKDHFWVCLGMVITRVEGAAMHITCRQVGPHILDKLFQLLLAVVYANESGVQLRLPEYGGRLHMYYAMLQVHPASASAVFLLLSLLKACLIASHSGLGAGWLVDKGVVHRDQHVKKLERVRLSSLHKPCGRSHSSMRAASGPLAGTIQACWRTQGCKCTSS